MQTPFVSAAWVAASVVAVVLSHGGERPAHSDRQNGLVGRYVLRSVNGQLLPAPIPGEDVKHKVSILSGVLELRQNGSYVCETVSRATYLGYTQQATDTLHGPYGTIGGGYVTFGYPKHAPNGFEVQQVDTVPTGGFQISWHHGIRRGTAIEAATFVYSK